MATRWGILSAGKISHDFVTSFLSLDANEHKVVAVAARSLESAKKFAASHKIEKAYPSYEELVKDSEIDVVYVGAINPTHLSLAKLALNHGKHVLCEKPLCMNVRETKELLEHAKEKKLFLMEGIWSRFFPSYKQLREELKANTIGDVKQVLVTFGVEINEVERCKLKELGGGTVLDIGIYCAQFASYVFNGEKPLKVVSAGHLNSNGVDESTSTILIYEGGRTATFVTDSHVTMPNEAFAVGTNGTIKLRAPFWCSTAIETPSGVKEFELPDTGKEFVYGNSEGLAYQCHEVRRCIQNGLTESPVMSHYESLLIAEILESIRKQVGVVYPQDTN